MKVESLICRNFSLFGVFQRSMCLMRNPNLKQELQPLLRFIEEFLVDLKMV